MATPAFKTDFSDRIEARGEAEMLLRIAAKRGIEIDEQTRDRVLGCTDTATIESRADRVLIGRTAEEIFGG